MDLFHAFTMHLHGVLILLGKEMNMVLLQHQVKVLTKNKTLSFQRNMNLLDHGPIS